KVRPARLRPLPRSLCVSRWTRNCCQPCSRASGPTASARPIAIFAIQWCLTVANKSDVFQRLIGLETEYALYAPPGEGERPPNRHTIFSELLTALRRKIPCARARNMKEGAFHAAGGAVWFETERPALGGGLIEGSTPECRSPRQLLAWQRAQDELLAESVQEALGSGVRLIKNDRDAAGN